MYWTVVISLLLGSFIHGVTPSRPECREDNIKVMSNFDKIRFAGTWFEYSWKVYEFLPLTDNFMDPQADYIPFTDAQGRDGFIRNEFGRVPFDAPDCIEQYNNLTETGIVGKYTWILDTGALEFPATFWIIDTDYRNYAMTIGCREVNSAGFCTKRDSKMLVRAPFPDPQYVILMDRHLERLCLTRDQYTIIDHNTECVPGSWGRNPAPVSTEPDYEVDIKDDDNDEDDSVSNRSLAIIIVDLIICVAFVCVLIILLLHCCGCRMVGPNHEHGSNKPGFSNFGQRISTTSNYGSNHYKI